mmetsp:Transcript_2063/g.2009  ORF Transcript_2063/g.2009 Transcript_2063/m.2009 type:complete len:397 (-) Transcript_2063:78-1268(-)
MEQNRPKTTLQRSRKGKKSWRKNIDIDDVEKGLEEAKNRQRLLGDDNDDFIIDTEGDVSIGGKSGKKLKSTEILSNKSKVKPLAIERNNKKIQGVNKHEVHRLMKLSGKVNGESKLKTRVEKDGLFRAKNEDLWGEEPVDNTPEILLKKSTSGHTKAKNAPKTLKTEAIRLSEQEKHVDAGKSYNPSLASWKALINKEYTTEHEKELKRQELIDHQQRIKNLIANLDENEEESSEDEQNEEDEEENVDKDFKLSINKPTQVKIKTKSKRNREAKHKQRMELEQQLKELKHQINELAKLDEYNELASAKHEAKQTTKSKSKKQKKLFKYDSITRPLEVKLSDELTNNLKNLKPEGNLFYDSMINLQENGLIETRVPVAKRRRYTPKITEKWTYKDFK